MAEYNPSKIVKDGNTYNFRDDTKIPLAGSNQISGSLIPSTNGTVNLGSPSYQWNNLYAKNYFYNGVAWGLDKANVWNTYQTIEGYYFGNEQSTNGRTCLYLTSNRDTVGQSGIYITKFRQNRAQGAMSPADLQFITFDVLENSVRTNGALQLNVTNWNEDGDVPSGAVLFSNLSNAQLGTSTYKWKSLNGINPGALSLPSISSGINLDLTGFKLDGSDNKFRLTNFSNYPYDNGWLFVRLNGCTSYYLDHWYKVVSNEYASPSTAIFFMPINDIQHDIVLRCVCTSINYIRVFPCQGNI